MSLAISAARERGLKITLSQNPLIALPMMATKGGFRQPPLDFLRCDFQKTLCGERSGKPFL
jgi:hypothetical protein